MTYQPLDGKPLRLTLGLRTLDSEQWIEVDEFRADELRQKLELLRERHGDVVATLADGDAGSRELWHRLAPYVVARFPELYTDIETVDDVIVALTDVQTGERIDVRTTQPIDACGRLVQEDFALMRKRGEQWVLVAASLCFPSRWRMLEKLGKDLNGIHEPVPGYEAQIANPVAVMFDKLTVDRPLWRLNWTLLDDPTLHQPEPGARRSATEYAVEDLGRTLFFRVERQTLTKLPASGDVVFTIRTYVRPLAELGGPQAFADLAAALRSADPDTLEYKGWSALLGATLTWLDAHSR